MTLDDALARHLAHAAWRHRLDTELGQWHGLAWDDFVLLTALDAAGGAMPTRALASRMGLSASALVLRLLPLEKTGLVARAATPEGVREVILRGPGKRLVAEATDTAQDLCAAHR